MGNPVERKRPAMKDFSLKIGRKNWKVQFVTSREVGNSWGCCDYPSAKNPRIQVYRNASRRDLVNTLLHEVLHAVRPELSEEAVTETADVLERALNRLGYELKE